MTKDVLERCFAKYSQVMDVCSNKKRTVSCVFLQDVAAAEKLVSGKYGNPEVKLEVLSLLAFLVQKYKY